MIPLAAYVVSENFGENFPINLLTTAVNYEPEQGYKYIIQEAQTQLVSISYLKAVAYFNQSGNHLIEVWPLSNLKVMGLQNCI